MKEKIYANKSLTATKICLTIFLCTIAGLSLLSRESCPDPGLTVSITNLGVFKSPVFSGKRMYCMSTDSEAVILMLVCKLDKKGILWNCTLHYMNTLHVYAKNLFKMVPF